MYFIKYALAIYPAKNVCTCTKPECVGCVYICNNTPINAYISYSLYIYLYYFGIAVKPRIQKNIYNRKSLKFYFTLWKNDFIYM